MKLFTNKQLRHSYKSKPKNDTFQMDMFKQFLMSEITSYEGLIKDDVEKLDSMSIEELLDFHEGIE